MRSPIFNLVAGLLSSVVGLGCGGSGTVTGDGINNTPGGIDEAAIMSMAANFASMTPINATPFRSSAGQQPHADDPMVDVYVNATGLTVYRSIDPTLTSAAGPFAEGTLIVKRNDAQPPLLTAMYKAQGGYDAEHGDWWYGRLNEDGSSTGYTGKVDFCISCHGARIAQDYAFGVPRGNRRQ